MSDIRDEQDQAISLQRSGLGINEIARQMNLSRHQVRRRLKSAEKAERIDPELRERLASKGFVDLAGLNYGWLLEKDSSGSGCSLYFNLGPDQEKISFVDAIKDVLSEIPRAPLIPKPKKEDCAKDFANWFFLADWHLGGEYGADRAVGEILDCYDDVVVNARRAEKAVICGLGDLLDANDHKGVTPASGNPTDTKRDNHLINTRIALRVLKHVIHRALENHEKAEVHLVRGNHDESSHHAVLLALGEYFWDNRRVEIVIPETAEEEEFRVISWGQCAFFPHHGDKAKPQTLRDIFSDQFSDEWTAAKVWRLIATGHYHTYKAEELIGAEHRQFGSPHRPNRWSRLKGFFNRGRISVMTVHKDLGLKYETHASLTPMRRGKVEDEG